MCYPDNTGGTKGLKMVEKKRVSDDEILSALCDEILREDWFPSVIAATAARLGIAPSTITRRFRGTDAGLKEALVAWVLDVRGLDGDWSEVMAAGLVEKMEEQVEVDHALEAATSFNWELVESNDHMYIQMLLWSRIRDDLRLRSKMQAHYAGYDRVHRTVWQDLLSHLRERTGRPMVQRPGLTEHEFIVLLDAMVEGFMLRVKADPTLPIASIYANGVMALIAGGIDIHGDLRSIREHLRELVEHGGQADASAGSAPA